MPAARSFLASVIDERTTRGGGVKVHANTSSEVTPQVGTSAPAQDAMQSPPKDEGRAIELSLGSESSIPAAEDQVAESAHVAGQEDQVEGDRAGQERGDLDEAVALSLPEGRASKSQEWRRLVYPSPLLK